MHDSSSNSRGSEGFTLIEVMMTLSISTIVLGAIILASVTLQKSLQASNDYNTGLAAQLRALDYIAMDARRAITVTYPPPAGEFLDLFIPNYYNTTNPAAPVPNALNFPPLSGPNGAPLYYGTGTIEVYYSLTGGNIVRTYNGVSTVIVSNVQNVNVIPPVSPDPNIQITISFLPSFHFGGTAADQAAQTGSSQTINVIMRNSQSQKLDLQ